MVSRVYRIFTGVLMIFACCFNSNAQGLPSSYTFDECDALSEGELRAELNGISQRALARDVAKISAIVDRQWLATEMNATLDNAVEQAITRAREDEGYLDRLWSGWSPDKANELVGRVANDAFGSKSFKRGIEKLSARIAEQIVGQIETATVRSASSALSCLQEFIGRRYSKNMVSIFEGEIKTEVDKVDFTSAPDSISLGSLRSTALAGVGVIIGTQIAKRLARRLTQRIAGRIVTRIIGRAAVSAVPVAGWIVGLGMIAWDLIEGADGALPQIRESLQSEEVKAEIRREIVLAIEPELERELPKIAREISNDVYSTWVDFKKQYTDVLKLAEKDSAFRAILETATNEDIYRLARLVAVSLEAVGRDTLHEAVRSGLFERLFALPESTHAILAAYKSYDAVIAWSELAGAKIDAVTAFDIYKLRTPETLQKDSLNAVIEIDSKLAIGRLLLLDNDAMKVLLTLPAGLLRGLAEELSEDDLVWLSRYVSALDNQADRNVLISRLLQRPSLIEKLKNESVLHAVANSSDLNESLEFIGDKASLAGSFGDLLKLASGTVSVRLFWEKYGSLRNTVIVLGVMLIIYIGRRLRRNSRAPRIVVNVPPSGNQPSGNQPSGNQPSGNQPSGNQPSGNQP